MDLLLVEQPGFWCFCFDSPCNILKTRLNVSGVSLFGKFPSLTGVLLDFSKLMSFEEMFSSSRVLTVAQYQPKTSHLPNSKPPNKTNKETPFLPGPRYKWDEKHSRWCPKVRMKRSSPRLCKPHRADSRRVWSLAVPRDRSFAKGLTVLSGFTSKSANPF